MATALNMTMALKQDPQTQQLLAQVKATFADKIQPAIDAALRKSQIVHFARVLVIDDKYIQVITEFDGDKQQYTEFFRKELQPVFKVIFSMAEGVPSWDELNDSNTFYKYSKGFNLKALGQSTSGDPSEGWLFSAYGDKTVKDLLAATGAKEPLAPTG
jgi:hypothetical protein